MRLVAVFDTNILFSWVGWKGKPFECLSPFEMAYRGVREANTALRGLNDLLEDQTRRISHELHDQAGQLLASVYLALDELARELSPAAAARLDRVKGLLDSIEEQLRRLCAERGLNWDTMSSEQRESFIDDLIHEDRPCG